jgi:hypothetical protein
MWTKKGTLWINRLFMCMRGVFVWMHEDKDVNPKIAEVGKKGHLCRLNFSVKSDSYN